LRRLDFLAHKCFAVAPFHSPARHRVEGWRRQRFTGAQAEAAVVPRASHGFADDQSFCQRTAVVRAGRPDGKQLIPAPREQHGIVADMPADHAAVDKAAQCNPLREIGPFWFGLLSGHECLLSRASVQNCGPISKA
jgi:hypothetical protein